jgi:creatinine amidohydrolase/Fe(II)-dependent formamide hydrolase-like protein
MADTPPARPVSRRNALALGAATLGAASVLWAARPLTAPLPDGREIADLTWVELRSLVEHGFTTVLAPSGGIEQNGPHLVLGKHDRIVAEAARRVAAALGRTLVAPVMSFVPQGDHARPSGNLRYPGTIGVTEEVFAGLLDGTARSLKAAGFRLICLMADHGGSQGVQREVAARLTREWSAEGVRVLSLDAYYADDAQRAWLAREGETPTSIGRHGGIQDTSELLAVYPAGVKLHRYRERPALADTGTDGDPTRSSAERGDKLLTLRVEAAVAAVRAARGEA